MKSINILQQTDKSEILLHFINSNQQTHSYDFASHIAAFLSVVLITEMLEICIQTSYDQNVQLILKSYLPVVYCS
jgi:predicted AlkP superfamily pyrophosphatase or phosphodiesterase